MTFSQKHRFHIFLALCLLASEVSRHSHGHAVESPAFVEALKTLAAQLNVPQPADGSTASLVKVRGATKIIRCLAAPPCCPNSRA